MIRHPRPSLFLAPFNVQSLYYFMIYIELISNLIKGGANRN